MPSKVAVMSAQRYSLDRESTGPVDRGRQFAFFQNILDILHSNAVRLQFHHHAVKMSILVGNLSKLYGDAKAVDDISFEVHSGEILGFLGPNGAGKTTTMRIITCYLAPSAGSVKVEGKDIRTESIEVRRL